MVLADSVVADTVPADNVPNEDAPLATRLFIAILELRFTVGLFPVPPVVIFVPGCTRVMSFVSVVEKIEYKFVVPEIIVFALSVPADRVVVNTDAPLAVTPFTEMLDARFTIGLVAVPPVVIFVPG